MTMTAQITDPRIDADHERGGDRIKVLLADDHPMVIAGIRRTIEPFGDIEVVGEAHSGPELMGLVERRRPSLVLLDLRMPGVDGVEHIEQIRQNWPSVKIVVLSACDDRRSIDSALRAGASAYILKTAAAVDVASVLRQASSGSVFHAASSGPASPIGGSVQPEPDRPLLTDREGTILNAVAAGLTTSAISRDLWVSEHTVKFHLTNIYRKLGVANRAGAVRYAFENDLVAA
ncbi:MAG TPA: response regulator transcription factor [Solirubrobacteraceae bacterium]|jgi:DNA-binding NarL/FixJ family response regulator|nr:response regulator transcription factor [Solirubrobacteraceae bacterium]